MREVTRTIVEKTDKLNPIMVRPDGDYFSSYSHFGIHHEMLNVNILVCVKNCLRMSFYRMLCVQ